MKQPPCQRKGSMPRAGWYLAGRVLAAGRATDGAMVSIARHERCGAGSTCVVAAWRAAFGAPDDAEREAMGASGCFSDAAFGGALALAVLLVIALAPSAVSRAELSARDSGSEARSSHAVAGAAPTASNDLARWRGGSRVAPDDAMAAFEIVDRSIRAWSVPPSAGDDANQNTAADPMRDAWSGFAASSGRSIRGASITLRFRGEIIGRGTVVTLDPPLKAADHPVFAALRDAWREADARLPGVRDAGWPDVARELAREITISLELGAEPSPFAPASYAEIARELSPGLDGVAARVGTSIEAAFPSTMSARGTDPGDALAACVGRAAGDATLGIARNPLTQPPAITKSHDAVFYRFRVTHVVQADPGSPARFLHRGSRLVPPTELTTASLREWARGIAEHLARRVGEGDTIGGVMWPSGAIEPAVAAAGDHALVAASLSRYSRTAGTGAEDSRRAIDASQRVMSAAIRLLKIVDADPASASDDERRDALAVLAAIESMASESDPVRRAGVDAWRADPSVMRWIEWIERSDVRRDMASPDDPAGSAVAREMNELGAYVLASRSHARAAAVIGERLRALTELRVHRSMPWLGWADLVRSRGANSDPAAVFFREWRDGIQAGIADASRLGPDDTDLAGGLALLEPGGSGDGVPSLAQANCAAFLATMLATPALTDPGERATQMLRLLSMLRYLRQMSVDSFAASTWNDPRAALWGVRAGPGDHRVSPAAAAMTLWAICETLDALASK